jgi:hypothetical protein
MATEERDNFTSLVPGPADTSELDVSELDKVPVDRTTIKPSKYNINTSKVAPIVEQELVEIDDELFKKILFFTIYYPSDTGLHLFLKPEEYISPHILFKMRFAEEKLFKITTPKKGYGFINTVLTGFVETVIVFCYYLKTIDFYRNTETSKDKYNFSNCEIFDEETKSGRLNDAYKGWRFIFNKNDNTEIDITLGRLIYDKDVYRRDMYSKIDFISDNDKDFSTEINIRTTKKEIDTLRNYVELLEKLIAEEIVIELKDGELFANNTKIGFKDNLKNKFGKLCRNTFKRAATIHMGYDNTKLYDTILYVYRYPMISARYGLEIYNSNLCGGRNNKTRKRHRNKASHKKMRKSHNIRKRKATGKKRK